MKTLIKFINGKEVSRKYGYKNETDANNAAGSWLCDCTIHAKIRENWSVKITNTGI